MSEIIIVRHGQANSHATDEASYDQLSDLGHQQARWLGDHLHTTNAHFDQVITGTLSRQQDTARSMGFDITRQDPRLNELDYFALAGAVEATHGLAAPTDPSEFAEHLPKVLTLWAEGNAGDVPETFATFHDRTTEALSEIVTLPGRTLVVTSGGVIGMTLRRVLALEIPALSQMMLQTMNSSMHRLTHIQDRLVLSMFNATPHLDHPERAHARTFV